MTLLLMLSAQSAFAAAPVGQPPLSTVDVAGDGGDQPKTEQAEQKSGQDQEDDWTWFGMGFESRQDRFREEMGVPVPGGGAGHRWGQGGGGGNGR